MPGLSERMHFLYGSDCQTGCSFYTDQIVRQDALFIRMGLARYDVSIKNGFLGKFFYQLPKLVLPSPRAPLAIQ